MLKVANNHESFFGMMSWLFVSVGTIVLFAAVNKYMGWVLIAMQDGLVLVMGWIF